MMSDTMALELGVILFCAGTLLGIPHGLSKRKQDIQRTELWRIAHLSTCVGGVSVIALSMALTRLLGEQSSLPRTLFTVSACLFFTACSLSGATNASWDGDRSRPAVKLVYGLQIAASIVSIMSVGVTMSFLARSAWH